MPTTFFGLPRELRNKIYAFAWTATPCVRLPSSPALKIQARYDLAAVSASDLRDEECPPLPRWIGTSKVLLEEAIEEFQLKSHIALKMTGVYRPATELGWRPQSLLSASTARKVHIYPQVIACDAVPIGSLQPTRYHLSFFPADTPHLKRMLDHFAEPGHLKVLKIFILLSSTGDNVPQTISLAPLAAVIALAKQLRRFELFVDDYEDSLVGKQTLETVLRAEVKRLGDTALVGWERAVERQEGVRTASGYTCVRWRFDFTRG